MKKASITEAKNGLSKLIDSVKAGASVVITDRGRPVARLEPVSTSLATDDAGQLARLIRNGVVRPGRNGVIPKHLFASPPPRLKGHPSIVEALLEERRGGR